MGDFPVCLEVETYELVHEILSLNVLQIEKFIEVCKMAAEMSNAANLRNWDSTIQVLDGVLGANLMLKGVLLNETDVTPGELQLGGGVG